MPQSGSRRMIARAVAIAGTLVVGLQWVLLIAESDLDQWRTRTSGRFSSQMLPGGHFYLTDEPQLFTVLRPLLSTPEVGGVKC